MKHLVRTMAVASSISLSSLIGATMSAQAYPVDCAILLCLAGGWPASVPCAHARSVFIARITPWPVEPPLQIWNCPMSLALGRSLDGSGRVLVSPAAFVPQASVGVPVGLVATLFIQLVQQADIDISGEAFDFVRSIRVYHIDYRRGEQADGDCHRQETVRLGSYGDQGQFSWTETDSQDLPPGSDFALPPGCKDYSFRSVFVDWRDHAGQYGSEEVRY